MPCGSPERRSGSAWSRRIQRDVLTPQAIRYLVERATQIARERLGERDLEAERARLAEVEEELENLVRMVARLGKLGVYEKVLTDFEEERQALKASLAAAPPEVNPETLRS